MGLNRGDTELHIFTVTGEKDFWDIYKPIIDRISIFTFMDFILSKASFSK